MEKGIDLATVGLTLLKQRNDASPAIDLALQAVKNLRVVGKDRTIVIKGRVAADAIEDAIKQDKDK